MMDIGENVSSNLANTPKTRRYPKISVGIPEPTRPISFICVKYSNYFQHNILTSECIHDDLNEFIVVDNRSNIFYQTLGEAINAGIAQAHHDLLVIVHEDIVLLPGWQGMFEKSLTALEQHDPDWLVAGLVGWDKNGRFVGHVSGPTGLRNAFHDELFVRTIRIDEQVIVLRKSKGLFPDPSLPGIHNIGRDMVLDATRRGGKSYVINAPSIHKYSDANGRLILCEEDSEKIRNRKTLAYIHNKECSDEYLEHKWKISKEDEAWVFKQKFGEKKGVFYKTELTDQQIAKISSPIILIGLDGSETRLLSVMASNIGLFIGNDINPFGDCLEMVGSNQRAVYRKYRCPSKWQKSLIIPDLRASAIEMLTKASWPTNWGFKNPMSLLVLPELRTAFPKAKYVFMNRDPLTTVSGRSHITTRLDNEIGQTALPLAYDFANLPRETILVDNPTVRMAHGIAHQIGLVTEFKLSILGNNWYKVSFESLIAGSSEVLKGFADFCGLGIISDSIFETIDSKRAFRSNDEFPPDSVGVIQEILDTSRKVMGYK